MIETDIKLMKMALEEAKKASEVEEIPIGALLVANQEVLSRAHNTRESSKNPLHHAEMLVLDKAAKKLNNWRLHESTLYVTVEPCPMCLGALLQARVGRLVFGCADPKRGPVTLHTSDQKSFHFPSLSNIKLLEGNSHQIEVCGGVLEVECAEMLRIFFKMRRY